ncbi:MAG TPA: TolC family protein [Polyangiaceae bacterium]|nr:TolC family protein [Polyangiaceae bacterium]
MGQTAKSLVTAFIATALFSDVSFAQGAAQAAPAQTPPATPEETTPASSEPMDTAQPPTLDPDALPVAKDPMLVPVAPPANVVGSWNDVLRLVRQRSTALHIAAADVDQARALETRAWAGVLTQLSAGGSVSRALVSATSGAYTIPHPPTTLQAGVNLDQPLVNVNAWYGVGTAKERTKVADLSEKDTERTLLSTAAQAAVGVITASRVAESNRVSLASDLSTLDLTKRRAALGAATAVDVLRAAQEVATARAQLVTGDESLRQAREALGAALGFTSGWGVSPNLRVEDLERTAGRACRSIGDLSARADLLSAEHNVVAAKRDRQAIDYLYAPSLDLVSAFGYTDYLYTQSASNGSLTQWTIGAQLKWLLFDGGDRAGQARFTEDAETIAREQLTQKKRDATLQLTQADRAILVAQASLQVSTSARDIAKEQARLARLAFINGSGTSFDLVDSARALREAEIDLLIKQFQVFQARLVAFLSRSNCRI